MNIHILKNMSLPIQNSLDQLLKNKDHNLNYVELYNADPFPAVSDTDWLIVMGGAMSANDEDEYPWLRAEKAFIRDVIDAGKPVLGICLGAQLISNALGGRVYKNPYPELGWHAISPTSETETTFFANVFNGGKQVFHSHGETFDVPLGAKRIVSSEACENQGFIFDDRVVALQFHPEITFEIAEIFVEHCPADWQDSPFVQKDLEQNEQMFSDSEKLMSEIIDKMLLRAQSLSTIS